MGMSAEELIEGAVGKMIEPDAIRWSCTLSEETSELEAVRVLTSMSIAVSLRRIADMMAADQAVAK